LDLLFNQQAATEALRGRLRSLRAHPVYYANRRATGLARVLLAVALLAALLAVALLAALLAVALLAALAEGGLLLGVVLARLVAPEPRLLLGVEVLLVAAVLDLLRVYAELVEQTRVMRQLYL